MILADVSLSTEAVAAIGVIIAGMAGAIGYLYKKDEARQAASEARFKAELEAAENRLKSWQQIAEESVKHLRTQANRKRLREGAEPLPLLAKVIPEHSSPPTERQSAEADIATARASLVAATLALDLEPRTAMEAEHEGGPTVASKAAAVVDAAADVTRKAEAVVDAVKDQDVTKG